MVYLDLVAILYIFLGVLHEALSVCCYSCTKIRFLKPYVTTAEGVALYTSSTMMMPFVTAATAKLTVGDIFVGAIPTKGVIYITNEDVSMVHFNRFATSISSNWPLFCISLLLAIDAGIIVWLLVSRTSVQHQFWSFQCTSSGLIFKKTNCREFRKIAFLKC